MADRVGQQLGNYRLVRLIGHGGFADVVVVKKRMIEPEEEKGSRS